MLKYFTVNEFKDLKMNLLFINESDCHPINSMKFADGYKRMDLLHSDYFHLCHKITILMNDNDHIKHNFQLKAMLSPNK